MSAAMSAMPQSIAPGALFVAIAVMTDTVCVLTAGIVALLLTLLARTRGVRAAGRYVVSGRALSGL